MEKAYKHRENSKKTIIITTLPFPASPLSPSFVPSLVPLLSEAFRYLPPPVPPSAFLDVLSNQTIVSAVFFELFFPTAISSCRSFVFFHVSNCKPVDLEECCLEPEFDFDFDLLFSGLLVEKMKR